MDLAIKNAELRCDVTGAFETGSVECAEIADEHAIAFAEYTNSLSRHRFNSLTMEQHLRQFYKGE